MRLRNAKNTERKEGERRGESSGRDGQRSPSGALMEAEAKAAASVEVAERNKDKCSPDDAAADGGKYGDDDGDDDDDDDDSSGQQ